MLIEIPRYQKRIKEKILLAINAPMLKTELGEGSSTQRAYIQTLNILSLSTTPTIEDIEFRENLANFYYSEKRDDGVIIEGVPYINIESPEPRRTGPLETSYPLLQGTPLEISQYVAKETDEDEDEQQDDEENKGQTITQPFSALNIQIPWLDKPEPIKNLPTPQTAAEMAETLTEKDRSQLTLLVAGPRQHVEEYIKNLTKYLPRKKRKIIKLAEISVKEGYITSTQKIDRFQWEQYQETKKSENNQPELKQCLETCQELAEPYIKALLKLYELKRLEEKAKKEWTDSKIGGGIPEETLQTKIDYEKAKSELRRSSLTWFYRSKMPETLREQRQTIISQEEELDKNITSLARALEKMQKLPSEEQKTLAENIKESTQALIENTQKIAEEWFQLQKDIYDNMLASTATFQKHPWKLHAIQIMSNWGYSQTPVWEPIVMERENWGAQDASLLQKILLDQDVKETHLAHYRDHKITYPSKKAKLIQNPGVFVTLPDSLKPKTATSCLNNPEDQTPSLKLDIRLNPRPTPATEILLENDNLQIQIYNPVTGRPTGLKDATLWRPIFTRKGIPHVADTLKSFGYNLEVSPQVHNYVEKKVKQAEKILSPNYPLTQYESLAYYENGQRRAEKTITHPETQEPLWIEGKLYQITPSWKRQTMMVDHSVEDEEKTTEIQQEIEKAEASDIVTIGQSQSLTKINNNTRIRTLTERRINFGFSTFLVEAEGNKTYEIQETVSKETLSMEKERIAVEIDHTLSRIEELSEKEKPSKAEANELRKLRQTLDTKNKELDHWAPMLEDFISAFPPEAPALSSEIHSEKISQTAKRIYARFAPLIKKSPTDEETSLKNYQLQCAALGAVKRSHCNSSSPGAGKTLMAIMAAWEMGHHYNWVICPTIAMKTWAKELERVGLYHEIVGYSQSPDKQWIPRPNVYQHMRELTQRFHKRIRQKNQLGRIEPEFYIVSAENVALGGEGNKSYSPWHYDYQIQKSEKFLKLLSENKIQIPDHWHLFQKGLRTTLRVWSDRPDNSKEISKAGLREFIAPVKFRKAVQECPKCQANGNAWTKTGHCKNCGHQHSATTKIKAGWNAKEHSTHVAMPFSHMTCPPEKNTTWTGEKTSNRQYPLYKLMGKHVGCKIIDEVHNWANFHSQHGAALLQVRSKDTIILSGTLCKTHINELEPSLCQIYEANSGEFPYSPWGMDLFREQFETLEIENTFQRIQNANSQQIRRRTNSKVVPEASNLIKLRALLHGVLCSVGETEMERVWQLKPIRESIQYVELQQENANIYQEWERLLRDAYSGCKTEHERVGVLRNARSQMTNLAYACDGPEKLEAAIAWIQEGMARNQRSVIVGPSTRFHKMLAQALKEREIPFASMSNLDPEKRFEFLNKFRDSDCPNFLSRIRLVNINFNQLTCCTRILFTGIDPSPAAIRQMQKRLNRIGQTETVECTFLITQLPPQRNQREIGPRIDVIEEINRQTNTNFVDQPTQTPTPEQDNRPFSYEERLFALVLRRETAIKQTLQQADRQRDPQELYEMLKDRQTLNQVLKDIVENAKSDEGITEIMQAMASNHGYIQEIPTEIPTEILTPAPAIPEPPDTTNLTNLTNLTPNEFVWMPIKKLSPVLQGELFNF